MKYVLVCLTLFIGQLSVNSQNLDYAKEVVNTLASTEFKGRGYVGKGNTIAAKYISSEFSKIGLKPFGKNYFQPFLINVNTFPKKVNLRIGNMDLFPGKDFIVDPSCPSIKGEFKKYHITKKELVSEEVFAETIKQVKGKILIIDERDYESSGKEEEKIIKERVNFLKYSVDVPSIATIILTSQKLTWSVSMTQAKKAVVTVNSGLIVSETDKINIEIGAKFITYNTNNVIGYIEGTEIPDSFLVITAHYDHLGEMGKGICFPGANDNASGVAMLLSLAKHFKENTPKYSVACIALTAEEIGIVGAKYFTENPLFDLSRIKFLVNFDLAGTGDDGIKVVNGTIYKDKFDELTEINETKNLLKSVQLRGEACNSDHCMFYRKGVPCFYIYTLGGISYYHDIYDKAETLPLTEFKDYSELMIEFFESF